MKFILVWMLVTTTPKGVTYSPPLESQLACQMLKNSMPDWYQMKNQCLQLKMGVKE